jgi:acetone carboxylase gamma subunit
MDENFLVKCEKYCSECGILKNIEKDFYKNKGQCIDCRKRYERNIKIKKTVKVKNDDEEFKKLLNNIINSIEDIKTEINIMKKSINRTQTFMAA